MGGGLMQLVASGAQDVYLTGNPQITFFKVVYRRHTNFSMESIIQDINGISDYGTKVSSTISRNGDLIHKMYLNIIPIFEESKANTYALPNNYGHMLIDYADIEIGGQLIDRIHGHWIEVWSRLSTKNDIGNIGVYSNNMQTPLTTYQQLSGAGGVYYLAGVDALNYNFNNGFYEINSGILEENNNIPGMLTVPLPYWFCRFPGLSIPLIALQYHEIKLKIQYSPKNKLNLGHSFNNQGLNDPTSDEYNVIKHIKSALNDTNLESLESTPFDDGDNDDIKKLPNFNIELWVDYIYLDTDERRRFAQVPHEYLIEQVQRYELTVNTSNLKQQTSGSRTIDIPQQVADLNFNHPVKELIFAYDWDNNGCIPGLGCSDTKLTLKLNGIDRFNPEMPLNYFTRLQTHNYHTGPGNIYGTKYKQNTDGLICGKTPTGSEDLLLNYLYNNDSDYDKDILKKITSVKDIIYDSIGVYSFALKPEEHQPSGTCNFSRIDSAKLYIQNLKKWNPIEDDKQPPVGDVHNLHIYARNYNILRIMSGMAGLAYSN